MKFEIETDHNGKVRKFNGMPQLFEELLDDQDHMRGLVESAQSTSRNNSRALGRLVEYLYSKDLIPLEEVIRVVEEYPSGDVLREVIE